MYLVMGAANVPACVAKYDTIRRLVTRSYCARTSKSGCIYNRVQMCWLQAPAGLTSMLAADMHNVSIIQATTNGGLLTTACLECTLRL